jgi:tetratricopeptide (TPR) repeat protein
MKIQLKIKNIMLATIYLLLAFVVLLVVTILLIKQIQLEIQINKGIKNLKLISVIDKIGINQVPTISQKAFALGDFYFKKRKYNDAIEEYRNCLETWEEDDRVGIVFILNRLVSTYLKLEEELIALYYCKIALSLSPFSPQSLLNLNRLYDLINKNSVT